jgi:hypothetical protein
MKVTFAFYKGLEAPGTRFDDKLICWWTKSPYSHVELIVNGYMYSTSPRDGKVRAKKHIYDLSTWEYVDIKVNPDRIYDFNNYFKLTKGMKYDWMGILGFIFPLQDRTKEYFCSEWCSKAGIIMGISKLFLLEPSKTSPGKLYESLTGIKKKVGFFDIFKNRKK